MAPVTPARQALHITMTALQQIGQSAPITTLGDLEAELIARQALARSALEQAQAVLHAAD